LVSAFADTSPLILYSTTDLPHNLELGTHQSIATAESFLNAVKSTISECSSDAYILISQPGLHSSDFIDPESAPRIRQFFEAGTGRVVTVENGVGSVNLDEVETYVKSTCQARVVTVDASTSSFTNLDEDTSAQLIKLDFPSLPANPTLRQKGLSQNDAFLGALISMLSSSKYTVVYVSTPVHDPAALVRPEKQEPLRFVETEYIAPLKRSVPLAKMQSNETVPGGLLSRYQFFTTSLLTSGFIFLFLVYVVYYAASGLSAIQISYGSFEKEMGPHEQKKQR